MPPNMPEAYALLMTRCWQADPMSRPGFDTVLRLINLMINDMLSPDYTEEGGAFAGGSTTGATQGSSGAAGSRPAAPNPARADGYHFIQDL